MATVQDAYRHTYRNATELSVSRKCGCFACLNLYSPSTITQWVEEQDGTRTAVCPLCGENSVLGDASGLPITRKFLQKLHDYHFRAIAIPDALKKAHEHSSQHDAELLASRFCGCFYCLRIYSPSAIQEWIQEPGGTRTAVCPGCGVDSVLGDASGFPITESFLRDMHNHWFTT